MEAMKLITRTIARTVSALCRHVCRNIADEPYGLGDVQIVSSGKTINLVVAGEVVLSMDAGQSQELSRWLHEAAGAAVSWDLMLAAGIRGHMRAMALTTLDTN